MEHARTFEDRMVTKMTGHGARTATSSSREVGVPQTTLSKWLRTARLGDMAKDDAGKGGRGKRWTPEEKIRVVLEAEKALAEAAALLVLRGKAQAFLSGEEEGGTGGKSEPRSLLATGTSLRDNRRAPLDNRRMTRSLAPVSTVTLATLLLLGCEASGPPPEPPPAPNLPEKIGSSVEPSAPEPEKRERQPRLPPIKGALPAPPDVAEPPADAERTSSGLAHKLLEKGRGRARPGPYDIVTVEFSGWTTDGRNFDNTAREGKALESRVNAFIPGWIEGLQLMVQGEKRRFWVPAKLAYEGQPRRPQGMLVFDIELVGIQKAPPLPPVPEDVAAPPADAERSASGLAWKVLRKGSGKVHATPASRVKIAYHVWDTDGKLYRSTVLDGRPAEMDVGRISSKGLQEGLQLMVKGERRRLWVPPELAYQGQPSGPQGMVVMDVEVLGISD